MRILVAEDDFTSRLVLAGVLKKQGHEPVEVVNGQEAWQVMQRPDAPRMAILDWMMPEMDGLEVTRRVRALQSDQAPYLIMLTSKSEKEEIVTGLEAGADDYLTKPFDTGELRARVQVGRRMIENQDALLESRTLLAYQATHDPMTGLLNRRAILERLHRELARTRRHGDLLAVGICDIDHFKVINDTHGHQTGDEVLCGFAHLLSKRLREYDAVGRLGGEEFLVVLPMKPGTEWVPVFEDLCAQVARTAIPSRSGELAITISIGVTIGTADSTVDAILEAADQALYRAKTEGRNRIAIGGRSSIQASKSKPAIT